MFNVEFIYKNNINIIQCNVNEKMKDIFNKFLSKNNIDKNSVFFLYSGNIINEEMKLSEIEQINENLKTIKILVVSNNDNEINNDKVIIKSKYIICPICKENIRFKINDYKIYLYDCKNGHKIDRILLDEFEKTQNINISEIVCDLCGEVNKGITYNNEFYKCLSCDINICPLCKIKHNKEHDIINYEQKNYICNNHNEKYNSYCCKCKKNLCMYCESEHEDKKNIIYYGDIIPKKDIFKNRIGEFKIKIDIFNAKIKEKIKKLNKIMKNIEIYYNINNNLVEIYNKKK